MTRSIANQTKRGVDMLEAENFELRLHIDCLLTQQTEMLRRDDRITADLIKYEKKILNQKNTIAALREARHIDHKLMGDALTTIDDLRREHYNDAYPYKKLWEDALTTIDDLRREHYNDVYYRNLWKDAVAEIERLKQQPLKVKELFF